MSAYEGTPGRTRLEGIHYACPCGALYPARVHAAINLESHSELLDELLSGRLNRLHCPACGAAAHADLPLTLHDPSAHLFALVLPEWARARELEERAALLARLGQDTSALVPAYVREAFVVYGPAGVRALLTARQVAAAPPSAPAPGPPVSAATGSIEVAVPDAAGPAEAICTITEGRVRMVARGGRAALEPFVSAPLSVRIMLHRLPSYPLCVLAAIASGPGEGEQALCVPLDFRAPPGAGALKALAAQFAVTLELRDGAGHLLAERELLAPLEENARLLTLSAQEHLARISEPSFARAAQSFAEPGSDRLGRKRHNFAEDSFGQIASPSAARLAVGIVGYWSEPQNEDYLILVQSFPLVFWQRIRSRVAAAAIEYGVVLPKALAEHALGEGQVASRRELATRLLANFAEVSLHLKKNDLDPAAEWENWQQLLRECASAGVAVDPQVAELARVAGKRAQESADAELPGAIDSAALVANLHEVPMAELLKLIERRDVRRDAAVELCGRAEAAAHAEALFLLLPKLTRGEAVRVIPALCRLGPPAEAQFQAGLGSRKSFVRQGCALALGVLRSAVAADALARLLVDEPTDIWKEVARSLGDIGESAATALAARIRAASADQRERIAFALAHVSARGARAAVEALVEGQGALARAVALRALVLHDAAQAADREVRAPDGPRENTVVRGFTRRFYEALAGEVREVSAEDLVETEEVLSDSDVVEVEEEARDAAGPVRPMLED
ncbi:MAG TPA: CpXC domain-containing protein [Polyangia bacterium]|nr:CpXC domain-containing protein [Polyangia bacterium]